MVRSFFSITFKWQVFCDNEIMKQASKRCKWRERERGGTRCRGRDGLGPGVWKRLSLLEIVPFIPEERLHRLVAMRSQVKETDKRTEWTITVVYWATRPIISKGQVWRRLKVEKCFIWQRTEGCKLTSLLQLQECATWSFSSGYVCLITRETRK